MLCFRAGWVCVSITVLDFAVHGETHGLYLEQYFADACSENSYLHLNLSMIMGSFFLHISDYSKD